METQECQRKWEALNRALKRLKNYYQGFVRDGFDSFQGPKDFANHFFHISYGLKEATIKVKGREVVDRFVNSNEWIALSMDITNQEKHGELTKRWTGKQIGVMTSRVHLLSPDGKDRTELKIEIDGKNEDCLELAHKIVNAWGTFLIDNRLIT